MNIFVNILPIFIIAMLGSIIKRQWITSDEFWRGLEKLLYFLLFPLVLFKHTSAIETSSHELVKLILSLMSSTILVTVILVIYRYKTQHDKLVFTSVFQGAIRFNNYIFLGLGQGLFSVKKMELVAVVSVYMIIFTNILSILAFGIYANGTQNKLSFVSVMKNLLVNPLIIASCIGLMFNYYGVTLNISIKNTIDILSKAAPAIGVLNVGSRLQFHANSQYAQQIAVSIFSKLILLPLISITIFFFAGITGDVRKVGILFSCLPPATTSYLLSKQLNGDPESMTIIITFSTILSLLSLFVIMYIFT